MAKRFRFPAIIFLIIFIISLNGQVKIKELPSKEFKSVEYDYLSNNSYRKTILLNQGWRIYLPDSEEAKAKVKIPSSFSGSDELVFKKDLRFSQQELETNHLRLYFLGLSYSAEIYLNGQILYKCPSANIPFTVDLPREILTSDSKNTLMILVSYKLDSESTLPAKQNFQSPANTAGIFREVYLQFLPKNNLGRHEVKADLSNGISTGVVSIKNQVQNFSEKSGTDQFALNYQIFDMNGNVVSSLSNISFSFQGKDEISLQQNMTVANPVLWSPDTPANYKLKISLVKNGSIVDEVFNILSFFNIAYSGNEIKLNNQKFVIKGVTYFPVYKDYNELITSERLKKDLMYIKNTGFNTVKFSKIIPSVTALNICAEIGLLVFVELPIDGVPVEIAEKSTYHERVTRYSTYLLDSFRNMYSIGAIGLGSGYLAAENIHSDLISNLARLIKNRTNKLVYAGFLDFPYAKIPNLDLYGFQLYNKDFNYYSDQYLKSSALIGKNRIFISEATYAVFNGSTNGYKNDNSFEAQAKYFEDLITDVSEQDLPGFIINSMFDYRSEFTPFSSGYSDQNIVQIGLIDENRTSERLAYKVVRSKLNKEEKITIPMGYKKDDAPIFFILVGLGIAVALAILFNAKRKFREDAIRALLRPYNFYADIRDQRILSGLHSNFLMVILASGFALLLSNLLFFLRTNIFLEKFVLSFGSYGIIKVFSYLAWNPINSFIYFFIFIILLIFVISLLIQAFSFFVKTKVLFSSVFFTVTWSFLPFAVILPLELVLYRILNANLFNIYVYGFLVLFFLWVLQRIIKGIYVIFDVRSTPVYFYSFILIFAFVGGFLLYFHFSESTLYYIINTFRNFSI